MRRRSQNIVRLHDKAGIPELFLRHRGVSEYVQRVLDGRAIQALSHRVGDEILHQQPIRVQRPETAEP